MVGGVGHQLNVGGAGGEQRAHHDAGQQDAHYPAAPGTAADEVDQHHRQQAEAKGENRGHDAALSQQDGQRRAETGSRGRAQNIRRGHGVLEHRLVTGTGGGQGTAHQAGHQDAGQADVVDGDGHVVRPRLGEGEQAGQQDAHHLAQRHIVAPPDEGQEEQRRQCQRHQAHAAQRPLPVRRHGAPPLL